ncbi:Uncharacterised protein [Vibrio cholerae]|nr:Uncharacterised protein [Vibrio cholerae]CSD37037.1 Uncharacterised protein [Vibrio cholerae]
MNGRKCLPLEKALYGLLALLRLLVLLLPRLLELPVLVQPLALERLRSALEVLELVGHND